MPDQCSPRAGLEVALFTRGAQPGFYSIERVAAALERAMPETIQARQAICPVHGGGIWRRLVCLLYATAKQAAVNHITGDISFVAAVLPGTRTVVTVHDFGHLYELKGLRRAAFQWAYFSMPFRRCRAITVISSQVARELRDLFPWAAAKVRVIPDCVPDGFRAIPREFNTECPLVLQIGTRPNKNVERTVMALSGMQARLHIVGALSSEQRALLEQCQVPYANSVNISESQLLDAYAAADVVTFASTYEGFGLPILEAQAVGRPVITSNLEPMSEVAGGGACLVNPYSVQSIRDGIWRIVNDPDYRAELVRCGAANVTRYKPHAVAAQFAALYQS